MGWKKLSKKTLLKHPRITVSEDIVQLPNGTKTDYIYFEGTPDSATIIARDNSGKILVQQEYSYPPNKLLFQFPGGGINPEETPLEGAVRELEEEANLIGELTNLGSYYTDNRRHPRKQFAFLATNLISSPGKKDLEEDFIEHWLTEKEIDQLIKDGLLCLSSALSVWQLYKLRK